MLLFLFKHYEVSHGKFLRNMQIHMIVSVHLCVSNRCSCLCVCLAWPWTVLLLTATSGKKDISSLVSV